MTKKLIAVMLSAVTLLCVFTSIVSQAFLRRVPSPQGLGYRSSPPCAGNLFCHGGTGIHPCPATASYYTTKSGLRRKKRHMYGFAVAIFAADIGNNSLLNLG